MDVDPELLIKHYGNLKKIRSDARNKLIPADLNWVRKPEGAGPPNVWYWGAPNTGKSRRARAELGSFYQKMNNKWWESYDGEANVLLEDVDRTHEWMGSHLKIWADRYGFRAEIKCDSAVMRPEKIFVTSNYHPKEIFNDPSVCQAILDRFNVVEITALQQFDLPLAPRRPPLVRQQRGGAICRVCYLDPCCCEAFFCLECREFPCSCVRFERIEDILMDEDEI